MAGIEKPIREIYVQPGESHLVSQPAILRTVLGSCVGVTFLVPRLGLGALCHPMMPECPLTHSSKLSVEAGRRYVDFAICDMASQLDSLGVARGEAVVKLFGGNDVLPVGSGDPRGTIGKQNCEAAIRVLGQEGFHVATSRLGGRAGIHIAFDTATGEVLLRQLDSGASDPAKKVRRSSHRIPFRR
jgi:chemotaxis protein CheD